MQTTFSTGQAQPGIYIKLSVCTKFHNRNWFLLNFSAKRKLMKIIVTCSFFLLFILCWDFMHTAQYVNRTFFCEIHSSCEIEFLIDYITCNLWENILQKYIGLWIAVTKRDDEKYDIDQQSHNTFLITAYKPTILQRRGGSDDSVLDSHAAGTSSNTGQAYTNWRFFWSLLVKASVGIRIWYSGAWYSI